MSETRVEESRNPGIDEIIRKAVVATRLSCARDTKDAFKATEKRLYAYPVLQAKKKDDEEMLEEIMRHGVNGHGRGITRIVKNGARMEEDKTKAAVVIDLKTAIADDQHEIERIEKALEQIADDEYRDIVRYKYFEQKTDDEIAEQMHCASRTVRAHKSRLVGRLSVFLYGAAALL